MSDVAVDKTGTPVTIEAVLHMPSVPELWCNGRLPDGSACRVPLRVKALHSDFYAPHFHGRHRPGCDHGSERSQDEPGDRGHAVVQGPRSVTWRLQLTRSAPSTGPDGRRRPDDSLPASRTRRSRVDAGIRPTPGVDRHALSVFLDAAMAGSLPHRIEIPPGPPRPTAEVVIPASAARRRHHAGREALFWGEIEGIRPTRHKGVMLRLTDAADDVAILLTQTQLERLLIDPDRLVGRHVIAFGMYVQPHDRRPYVKAGSIDGVAFSPGVRVQRTTGP